MSSVSVLLCFFGEDPQVSLCLLLLRYFLHAAATPCESWVNGSTWDSASQRWRGFSAAEIGPLSARLNDF